jgi:hypothetical protein
MPIKPPYDCRITVRCIRHDLGLKLPRTASLESLSRDNDYLDAFFEQLRTVDAAGPRIGEVATRDVYAFSDDSVLGATWFDETKAPVGIVWLLAAVNLSGMSEIEARARIANRERIGLFPTAIDYARFDLDRRKLDTGGFAAAVRRDLATFLAHRKFGTPITGDVAGVPVAALWRADSDYVGLYFGISQEPITGLRSERKIRLTGDRFLLIAGAVRQTLREWLGEPLIDEEPRQIPRELRRAVRDPRVVLLVYSVPR